MSASKTPLFALLRRAYRLAVTANKPHTAPADELIDQFREYQSRRAFLRSSGQLALLAGGVSALNGCHPASNDPTPDSLSVAIVGAGIAGLHAAHTFTKERFTNFTLYEGATHTGGRIRTAQNLLASGISTELGGEFIDSNHEDMLNLAQEFGLTLLDTQAPSELALHRDAYFFNGRLYSLAEIVAAFQQIASKMEADIARLPETIDYNTTGFARDLDQLSISAYLQRIGAQGIIKTLLEVAYETEYGLSPSVQSCINMLFLISTDTTTNTFEIFGDSDERYKIAGGNQQITDKLTDLYKESIKTGYIVKAINQRGSKLELVFTDAPTVLADAVLLTLPFTKLREVDITVPLPALKKQSIQQLGYGTNAKLLLGFTNRPWRTRGYTGYAFTDNGLQSGWDGSQLQAGQAGGYTVFAGGTRGVQLGTGTPAQQAATYLPLLNQVFPGTSSSYNGVAERFHWPSYAFTKASYAAYTVGQWTSIGGAEIEPVGSLYFAGEHCSADFQGYMNGGAETGRRAAHAIVQALTA